MQATPEIPSAAPLPAPAPASAQPAAPAHPAVSVERPRSKLPWIGIGVSVLAVSIGGYLLVSEVMGPSEAANSATIISSASRDEQPLYKEVLSGRQTLERGDTAKAEDVARKILEQLGEPAPGGVRAEVGAEAQLLLADAQRQALKLPDALADSGAIPKNIASEMAALEESYGAVLAWNVVTRTQCMRTALGEAELDYAEWLSDKSPRGELASIMHDYVDKAADRLKAAAQTGVKKGTGCTRRATMLRKRARKLKRKLPAQ
jgi:hypothetical protein